MMRILIIIITASVLIGGGYAVGYLLYMPKLIDYVERVDALSVEVANLVQANSSLHQTVSSNEALIVAQGAEIANLQNESTSQRAQIATQQEQIANLETEKNLLKTDLTSAKAEIEYTKKQLHDKSEELLDLRNQLDDVLDIQVIQHYQWVYGGRTWDWDLPISIDGYMEFSERPRPMSASQLVDMATDPKDDYYIDSMVEEIKKAASEKRYNDVQKLNFVISFVQNLPYTVDEETTPYDEYPRYPLETLFDRGGDCEDTSILAAALLDRMGYDVVLLHLKNAQHVAIGVSLPSAYGMYYEYVGNKYFYLETTGEGWGVGDFPPDIKDSTAYIYPLP